MLLRDLLSDQKKILEEANVPDADLDAWLLMSYVFGISREQYYMNQNEEADSQKSIKYVALIKERSERTPLQHITGRAWFCGLLFKVTPDVLVPRQDTEVLVEHAVKHMDGKSVLDLCTGSGCIAVSSAVLGNPSRVCASDISEKALEVAVENAVNNNADVEFIKSDLFYNISGQFDLILTNPPYIPAGEIKELQPEVRRDPVLALDGGDDGLALIRRIAADAGKVLSPHGEIFMEIGYDQAAAVKEIFRQYSFENMEIIKDYAGLDRVFHCTAC